MGNKQEIIFSLHGLDGEKLLRVEEVAVEIGRSIFTINNWYRFKKTHPEDKYAKLLPEFYQLEGERQTRYWRKSDIPKLLAFRDALPKGNNGVMGDVTQRYHKKKQEKVLYTL